MKIGDYVRTKRGQIHKITDLKGYYENGELIEDRQYVHIDNHFSGWDLEQFKELIIKSSPDIIDLIEVGDYVNGSKVLDIAQAPKKAIYTEQENGGALLPIVNNRIESILTKEQFESMEYKEK